MVSYSKTRINNNEVFIYLFSLKLMKQYCEISLVVFIYLFTNLRINKIYWSKCLEAIVVSLFYYFVILKFEKLSEVCFHLISCFFSP